MKYKLIFSGQALADLEYHRRAGDTGILKKIVKLTSELEEHPATGTGQVEQLKYELSGKWSRRISQKHRLVYGIDEATGTVFIYSLAGHY